VWIIDKSLLSLKSDNSLSLLEYFYSKRHDYVKITYNLNKLIKRLYFNNVDDNIRSNSMDDGMDAMLGGTMNKSMSMVSSYVSLDSNESI
jgi:hypothetical protein